MSSTSIDELIELLQRGSAAAAYETIGKQGDMSTDIRALVPGVMCVGPAFTIKAHPHRAGAIAASMDKVAKGSVVVIDVGYDAGTCAWGGTGALAAQIAGIAGCVTNGHIRDIAEIRHLNFPMFALGSTVRGGRKEAAAECGVPVSVGGQVVCPGDLICADDDGVVVIAQRHFDTLAQRLQSRLAFEREADTLVRQGVPYAQAVAGKPALD